MDESSSRYCNKGDEKASCLPEKRRRIAQSIPTKPKERKKGFGIAELEKKRVEEEMKVKEEIRKYFKETLRQPSINGAGIQGLMTYGVREDISGRFKHSMIRSPSISGATSCVNPNCTVPTTLNLFEAPDHRKYGYIDLKRKDDENLSKESTCKNFIDPQELDLDLKL